MEEKQKENSEQNIVFVGKKPLEKYIRSTIVLFKKKNASEVTLKSRGKFIAKAIDITELAKRNYFEKNGIKVKEIITGTETFENEGKRTSISTMSIKFSR